MTYRRHKAGILLLAAGIVLTSPAMAFAAGPPNPAPVVATTISTPVEIGGLFNFLGRVVHSIVQTVSQDYQAFSRAVGIAGTNPSLVQMPVHHSGTTNTLATGSPRGGLDLVGLRLLGIGGGTGFGSIVGHNSNAITSRTPSSSGGITTTWTDTPITSTVQTVNPGQVLGNSGILTTFNGAGIPGQQLLNQGYHVVNLFFSGVNTGQSGNQVNAQTIANTIPPNTGRWFAKTLLVVAENNSAPWLTAKISTAQWIQQFHGLFPGIPVSMVGQPLWGQTVPPLYHVADSPQYNLQWSASQRTILQQAHAMNTPMPGALKVTLQYFMGNDGQWHLQSVFLHFWPQGNAINHLHPGSKPPISVNPTSPPWPTMTSQATMAGLTNSSAMQALAQKGALNSLQGTLLSTLSSGGTGTSPIIDSGQGMNMGPNLTAQMAAALQSNLQYTYGGGGFGQPSALQSTNTGMNENIQIETQPPVSIGLESGTNQSNGSPTFVGIGVGLAPGVGGQLAKNTVTSPKS